MSYERNPLSFAAGDEKLAKLTKIAQCWQRMDQLFKQQLPAYIAAHCQAVRINDSSTLIVFADNGSVASKLKLLVDATLPTLNAAGFSANQVQIKVVLHQETSIRQNRLQLSGTALYAISSGADNIANPALAEALRQLANHHRK